MYLYNNTYANINILELSVNKNLLYLLINLNNCSSSDIVVIKLEINKYIYLINLNLSL